MAASLDLATAVNGMSGIDPRSPSVRQAEE
jgi:hypothetical protein